MASDHLTSALSALDDCDAALAKLDAGCCDPGRSPSMMALRITLGEARTQVGSVDDPASADAAIATMEDAGAQIGKLQVTCCAPKRLPLYARILEGLTQAQLGVNRSLDRGH